MHRTIPVPLAILPNAPPPTLSDADQVWSSLSHLQDVYPEFRRWFWGRVLPGVQGGTRRIFQAGCGGDRGIIIAKKDARERKLCTVWVEPSARGNGLAARLVDEAIDWLGDPFPLLTVPEERLREFLPLARRLGFALTQALPSHYREGRVEYVFNGVLDPRRDA